MLEPMYRGPRRFREGSQAVSRAALKRVKDVLGRPLEPLGVLAAADLRAVLKLAEQAEEYRTRIRAARRELALDGWSPGDGSAFPVVFELLDLRKPRKGRR